MASAFRINPPEPLDFGRPDSWPAWKQRYERYRLCTKLNQEDGILQVSNLIYIMGGDSERVFASFTYEDANPAADPAANPPANPADNYDTVMRKFDEYFIPKRNIMHERAKFYLRQQNEGESIEHFVRSLYELAEYCDFRDHRDENIRDRLVLGIKDRDLTKKLQLETDLTLKKAIDLSRHYEMVTSQVSEQKESIDHMKVDRTERSQLPNIDQLRRGRRGINQKTQERPDFENNDWYDSRPRPLNSNITSCGNCGYDHVKGRCPAFNKECNYCHSFNHFARVCRKKSQKPTYSRGQSSLRRVEEQFNHGELDIPSITSDQTKSVDGVQKEPPWTVNLTLNSKSIPLKIDTGADVSVISSQTYNEMNPKPKLKKPDVTLKSPGGIAKCKGRFTSVVEFNGTQHEIEFYIVEGQTDNLLSREASKEMNLVQRLNSCLSDNKKPAYINPAVFGPLTDEPVKSEPVKICLTDKYEPYTVNTARRIPIPLLEKVKQELNRLKEKNIIEEIHEPTDFCAGMVPVPKKTGDVRICADYKKLNVAIKRERYLIPTLDDVLYKLKGSKVYSKLDAVSGFHQLKLDDNSAKLTTFITPFGRYYYKRLPFGISSAPEIFQRTMETILEGQNNVICYFDDILVYSDNEQDHKIHLQQTVDKLNNANLKLNEEKCEFFKDEIEFLGFVINEHGSKPDPKKIMAIQQMPEPSNLDDVRRLLGMVNFLGRYIPNLSHTIRPISELLEKKKAWTWGPSQSKAFEQIKKLLSDPPILAFYDPKKPTTVSSDSSSYGIAGVLFQNHNGVQRPVAYCSRTLTSTERNYAQIEKELLAVVWSCERFHRYLVGLEHFQIETDHKPLIPLINTKDLSETPIRCQRMLMRMLRFKVTATYTPGKHMLTADHLSRSPLSESEENKFQEEIFCHVHSITSNWSTTDNRLQKIREGTQKDINLKYAFDYTIQGWPFYKEDVKLAAREFFGVRGELSVVDGLLLRDSRIVIPFEMRKEILNIIHEGHQGISKCRQLANQMVWWPGISKDIEIKVSSCRFCVEKQPANNHEPMIPSELPDRPFQKIGIDIFDHKGDHFIVCIDYYSRWIDIEKLTQMTSSVVINKLKTIFATHGIPELVISDNGPQFSSTEFQQFSIDWNFEHKTSSPYYAQSNGEAERAVKTAKDILEQCNPIKALLMYRSTPIPSLGASPAEMAMGRKLRTLVPTISGNLKPRLVDHDLLKLKDDSAKRKQTYYYNRHYGVKALPTLHPGDKVFVRTDNEKGRWDREAEIIHTYSTPRSYMLETQNGQRFRRNRRHLRLFPPSEDHSLPYAETMPQELTAQTTLQTQENQMYANQSLPQSSPVDPHEISTNLPNDPGTLPNQTEIAPYRNRFGREIKKPRRFQDD